MDENQPNPNPTPDPAAAPPAAEPKPETVSLADHKRALDDLHKFKKNAEKLQAQLEADKQARMKEQNQWKELYEAEKVRAESALSESTSLKESFLSEKKYSALRSAVQGLGLRPEALSDLDMLDLAEIQVETTSTGKINVLGADKYAERLKAQKPHWFLDKKPPNVNTTGQSVHDQPATVTAAMVLQAQKEGLKTGDMSKYTALHKQLQMQNVRKH